MSVTFTLVLGPDESGGWTGHLGFTFVYTAIAAMPEDAANDLPAINVGDTATFSWRWDLSLSPSDPPVVLYPDAEWELAGG
jgi:hypothetical protein